MKQYINHLYFKIKVAFFYWGVWLINQLIRPNCLDVEKIFRSLLIIGID